MSTFPDEPEAANRYANAMLKCLAVIRCGERPMTPSLAESGVMNQQSFQLLPAVADRAILALQTALRGTLMTREHPGYDQARRVWNGRVDRHPLFIAQVRDAADVALVIAFGREQGLPIAIRGGGHNAAGFAVADNGVMIDLSGMKGLSIDAAGGMARAEAGLTLGELVAALGAHGLATTTGTCAGVGISGSTLGGGIGWLTGVYGMGIDNVLAFELVGADGRIRRISATAHPDLFWALRGGGGNFGVVTAIEYRVHPLREVFGGMLVYPLAEAAAPLRQYAQLLATAPDELGSLAVCATVPGVGLACLLQFCYAGANPADGDALLSPLRRDYPPAMDTLQIMPYAEFYMAHTPPAPNGMQYYDISCALPAFDTDVLDAMLAGARRLSSPFSSIVLHHMHGRATRVPATDTAFALRTPHVMLVYAACWETGPGQEHIVWADESRNQLRSKALNGLYVNFLDTNNLADVQASYAGNFTRLSALKAEYDPENLFRHNHNIPPAEHRGL